MGQGCLKNATMTCLGNDAMPAPKLETHTLADLQKMEFPPHPDITLRLTSPFGLEPDEVERTLRKILRRLEQQGFRYDRT
jgi:hypothetical protein